MISSRLDVDGHDGLHERGDDGYAQGIIKYTTRRNQRLDTANRIHLYDFIRAPIGNDDISGGVNRDTKGIPEVVTLCCTAWIRRNHRLGARDWIHTDDARQGARNAPVANDKITSAIYGYTFEIDE